MSIEVNCEQCGRLLRAKDDAAGRTGKCPGCGAKMSIPALGEPPPPQIMDAELVLPPEELPLVPPPIIDPSATDGQPRRPCPKCGESIVLTAAKCRFCGTVFDKRIAGVGGKAEAIDANMTGGDWALAVLCSGIGCILGIVWMIQGKPKGLKMTLVCLGFSVLWGIVRAAIMVATDQR